MSRFVVQSGRLAAAVAIAVAVGGLTAGVASAEEAPPPGTIQEVGGAVAGVEESTGAAEISDQVGEATGLTAIEDQAGVTKAEEGLGLG